MDNTKKIEFKYNPYEQSNYMLYDYAVVDVIAKVKFKYWGTYVVQTRVDMFCTEPSTGELDEDVFEIRDIEPCYIFRGINEWEEVDWEIDKIEEILEWHL